MEVCLFEPDIAGNVGNIIRTCACFEIVKMHIILPASFPLDNKAIKKSAMDYGKYVEIIKHDSFYNFKSFIGEKRIILLTIKATIKHFDFKYNKDDILMVGSESRGVDREIADQIKYKVVIPIYNQCRSLNVSNSLAIVASEVIRQNS